MKLFIWHNVPHIFDGYHDDGGVVAIARDLDHAIQIVNDSCKDRLDEDERDHSVDAADDAVTERDTRMAALRADGTQSEYWFSPPVVIDINDHDPMVWFFPNRGCC
jgi:hypothetical protein